MQFNQWDVDGCPLGWWVSDLSDAGGYIGQWAPNRPLEEFGDCVALNTETGWFTNLPCTQQLPFICEQKACRSSELGGQDAGVRERGFFTHMQCPYTDLRLCICV